MTVNEILREAQQALRDARPIAPEGNCVHCGHPRSHHDPTRGCRTILELGHYQPNTLCGCAGETR